MLDRFFIVAHRGASAYEPENTLRSIHRAIEMSADAVEVDVRLTSDGVPVIMHDPTVDRTTKGKGYVNRMPLKEIESLDAGFGEKVPRLDEVLDEVRGKAVLIIELKVDEAALPALRLVSGLDMMNDALFISFSEKALRSVLKSQPEAHTGLIYYRPGGWISDAKRIGCELVLPRYPLAIAKMIELAHKLHLRIIPWIIDDLELAKEMKERRADGIATNRPDIMIPLRDS